MQLADSLLGPTLRFANRLAAEGPWKNRLRASVLRLRNGLPREIMVKRGDRVVQVGMWRRRNLMRLSRCVGPAGSVVLIEADPRVASDLRSFVEAAALRNVTLVNKGAYHERGEIDLNVAESPSHNRISDANVEMLNEKRRDVFRGVERIAVDRVDNILRDCGMQGADYVEITVNGLEEKVLQGMELTLPQVQRVFVAGYARTTEGQPTNRVTEALLRSHGFHTTISRRTPPNQEDFDPQAKREWGLQEGHVFAWRD